MSRFLSTALILATCAGCAPPLYVEPTLTEAHGTVKVRMVYHRPPATPLNERVALDEFRIEGRFTGSREPSVTPVRIAPGPHRWRIRSVFSHTIQKQVSETYNERYSCGTERIGNSTRTKYCTRMRTRMVTRTEQVIDASCRVDQTHHVRVGVTYIAQFDFYGHQRCSLRYLEQRAKPDGTFDLVPAT